MMSYEYKTLDFFQVIYDESQREKCYPFSQIYFNSTLTDAFENAIIADLVPNSQAQLISVCSWRLAQKRGDCYVLGANPTLSKEKILNADFDIAILTPRSPQHKPLLMASEWHKIFDSQGKIIGTPWDDAFSVFKEFLRTDLNIIVPDELTTAIYENHFIAKAEIYKGYVRNYLLPCMAFVKGNQVFQADAGYITKKRDQKEVKAYQEKSGRLDWPIMPFILERLFSIFIEGKGYKVINL